MSLSPTEPRRKTRNRAWFAVIALAVVAVAVVIAFAFFIGEEEPLEVRVPVAPGPLPEAVETAPEPAETAAVAEPALDLGALRAQSEVFIDFTAGSLADWQAAHGNAIALTGADGILAMMAQSSLTEPNSGGPTGGAYVALPVDVAERLAGRTITVTVVAREARAQPAETFAVAYSTAEAGNSGWRRFDLAPDYATYSFDYEVADHVATTADYLGVWADTSGFGRGVEILAATIRLKR